MVKAWQSAIFYILYPPPAPPTGVQNLAFTPKVLNLESSNSHMSMLLAFSDGLPQPHRQLQGSKITQKVLYLDCCNSHMTLLLVIADPSSNVDIVHPPLIPALTPRFLNMLISYHILCYTQHRPRHESPSSHVVWKSSIVSCGYNGYLARWSNNYECMSEWICFTLYPWVCTLFLPYQRDNTKSVTMISISVTLLVCNNRASFVEGMSWDSAPRVYIIAIMPIQFADWCVIAIQL